jgi:hypothetical protein
MVINYEVLSKIVDECSYLRVECLKETGKVWVHAGITDGVEWTLIVYPEYQTLDCLIIHRKGAKSLWKGLGTR